MALLSPQYIITLVMVSVIQKVSPHVSFAKWILCSTGLIRYLHPTDDELKALANIPKDKKKGKGRENGHSQSEAGKFHVPRSLEVTLDTTNITAFDVVHLRYFPEYQWLLDFSLYALLVYVITEIYNFCIPPREDELNLSMIWCLLVVIFAWKLLGSLTVQYFRSDESIGERSTCIVSCLVYLLVAMMILIVPENKLEVGLDQAYASFNESATEFLVAQGMSGTGPASKLIVKFTIAVICAILGAFFTFPGLRMARMHWDSLRYCKDRLFMKILLNLSFAMPMFLVILWIKPISKDILTGVAFSGMKDPIMSVEAFETLRLYVLIAAVLLRFALMPVYLQAYLNLAYDRVQDLKQEAGRITNVDLQRKIASIFYYLCVVTLQYAAPLIMCLFLTFMYKTLGEFTWNGATADIGTCPVQFSTTTQAPIVEEVTLQDFDVIDEAAAGATILETAREFHTSLRDLKNVFNVDVYKGVLGFATWWTVFLWFTSTSLGMFYQSYFTKS